MRLIKQDIQRDGSGTVALFPEDPEDMVATPSPHFPLFRLHDYTDLVSRFESGMPTI